MDRFVFSMDSHVVEPRPLGQEGLPAHLRDRALRAERRDGYIVMTADGKDMHRMQVGDGNSDNPRIGGTNPNCASRTCARTASTPSCCSRISG